MTIHRAINIAIVLLIIILMSYVGPRLDEVTCLVGVCGFINLTETADSIRMSDVVVLWLVLILMVLCTLIVVFGALGYVLFRMGWL